ncbi:acetyl-CoA hydrolase/transferase C-terminal domain-containing protein [Sphingopyxis panaciterrulae]|uniref:Acyl-CoA hydrolase n=1 Tax=Sphingopyxis panaciterrulae TaxID=462372 RepID=A0A7W9B7K4_9SPHN|nr:acyl-CoA hydrolase [Sphingopyxis panaciterrulae]
MALDTVLDRFAPGRTCYLPGATGEILALTDALKADPDRMAGMHIIGCPLPGMNATDYAALHCDARQTAFLFPPASRDSLANGRLRILPLSYFGAARYLACDAGIDVSVAHVAAPLAGEGKRASVGIAADFTAIAWRAARYRIALVNPSMPAIKRAPRIDLAEADLVVECESPLVEVPKVSPDAVGKAIAGHVAALVPDGATLQIGIGSAPAALWRALAGRRGLRLRSGLASEDLLHLADQGALADGDHVAGILAGSRAFYSAMAERDLVRLADTLETHDARAIGLERGFFAANSALSVDLFGQVNLEWQGGRLASGAGGAPDFASAAMASPGGAAITMLPSTAREGSISRIVGRLDTPTVSLPRNLADVIVTEHGTAHLRYLSIDERAEALIAIAAPAFRDALSKSWRELRQAMN